MYGTWGARLLPCALDTHAQRCLPGTWGARLLPYAPSTHAQRCLPGTWGARLLPCAPNTRAQAWTMPCADVGIPSPSMAMAQALQQQQLPLFAVSAGAGFFQHRCACLQGCVDRCAEIQRLRQEELPAILAEHAA
eukprot:scaffold52523_cov21-Tisochrysis_lutea.AAC.1